MAQYSNGSKSGSPSSSRGVKGRQFGGGHFGSSIGRAGNDEGGRFVDRNLGSVKPQNEQFEPTDAEPVRQRFKMGGGC